MARIKGIIKKTTKQKNMHKSPKPQHTGKNPESLSSVEVDRQAWSTMNSAQLWKTHLSKHRKHDLGNYKQSKYLQLWAY